MTTPERNELGEILIRLAPELTDREHIILMQALASHIEAEVLRGKADENRYWIDRAGVPITSQDLFERIAHLQRKLEGKK